MRSGNTTNDKVIRVADCRSQVKLKVVRGKHEANHMLSCASCVRSAYEQGCAREAELVHEQYWQCEECGASHNKTHPAYQTLQRKKIENIHLKKSKLNSLQKWDINGNKHDRTMAKKRRTLTCKNQRIQLTQCGAMTQTRCTPKKKETPQQTYVS